MWGFVFKGIYIPRQESGHLMYTEDGKRQKTTFP